MGVAWSRVGGTAHEVLTVLTPCPCVCVGAASCVARCWTCPSRPCCTASSQTRRRTTGTPCTCPTPQTSHGASRVAARVVVEAAVVLLSLRVSRAGVEPATSLHVRARVHAHGTHARGTCGVAATTAQLCRRPGPAGLQLHAHAHACVTAPGRLNDMHVCLHASSSQGAPQGRPRADQRQP